MREYKLSRYITSIEINNSIVVYSLRTGKSTKLSLELWKFLSTNQIYTLPDKIIDHLKELLIFLIGKYGVFQSVLFCGFQVQFYY